MIQSYKYRGKAHHLNGFEAYHLFLALRNHFYTEKYDYFKHNKKVNASEHSYLIKKDRICYEEASRHYNKEELIDLIISNLIVGRKWIINIVRDEVDEAEKVWREYVKRRESFTYIFSQDLDKLLKNVDNPKDLFHIKSGQYPEIIIQHLNGNIPIETLSALDKFINFSSVFDRKLGKNDVIWGPIRLLVVKYKPFLSCDMGKIHEVIREKLLNTVGSK